MGRRKKNISSTNTTKERLAGTPFSTASALNAASEEIRREAWKQLEKARIKRELLKKDEYHFFLEPFRKGLTCRYSEKGDKIVRIFLTDNGIEVDINEELKSNKNSEVLLSALIRSASDSLINNYLKSMDILHEPDFSLEKSDERNHKERKK